MLKIGMTVTTVRACGALSESGSVDLAEGTKGRLLSVDGDVACVGLREGAGRVHLALDALRGCKGRPAHVAGA